MIFTSIDNSIGGGGSGAYRNSKNIDERLIVSK